MNEFSNEQMNELWMHQRKIMDEWILNALMTVFLKN